MKFLYPPLSEPLILSDEYISSLVVENRNVFFNLLNDLYSQMNKGEGNVVFSIDNRVEDLSKNFEIITQFIPFDCNKKSLITKLHQRIKGIANQYYYDETMNIITAIDKYLYSVTDTFDSSIQFDSVDVLGLLKTSNTRFENEYDSLSDTVFNYCKNVVELEGEKVFIFVGIRSYIEDDEFIRFCKSLVDHKYVALFIESCCYKLTELEHRTIIDNDMCVI